MSLGSGSLRSQRKGDPGTVEGVCLDELPLPVAAPVASFVGFLRV